MLSFAGSLKVFVAVEPCDMRKGFNDHDAAPVTAPLPARLQDRSLPSSGLLAHVLVSKNCDHLPLYRQEKIFARRHGVNLQHRRRKPHAGDDGFIRPLERARIVRNVRRCTAHVEAERVVEPRAPRRRRHADNTARRSRKHRVASAKRNFSPQTACVL